jgi:uncharacterized protein YjgD (DUF1641 family)
MATAEAMASPELAEVIHLYNSARDSLSDDIVVRLGATIGDALDLLDRINRSGIVNAIPILSSMVANGDLERLAQIARTIGSIQDALSDDIVGRLGSTVGDGLDLMDRVNRSGVDKLLPIISHMVENGDVERLAKLAHAMSGVQAALPDYICLKHTLTNAITLLDKVNSSGVDRLLNLLSKDCVGNMVSAIEAATEEAGKLKPSPGGFGGLWDIVSRPETQDNMRFLMVFAKHIRAAQLQHKK